ncbi:MAG: ABC-type multidrug transport system ATPase subunit [Planctomycetota bacterium]|jgi:ABC-type multidrug transport system ATPase subunit
MNLVLQIEGLRVRYGRKEVLTDIDLEVPEGSITVLLGPNGSGKSTLMRTILGLQKARAGHVLVNGLEVTREKARTRQCIGYVPDKPDAYPWMTLDELFAFLRPQYPNWSDSRARQLAAQMDVPLDQRFKDFSRGQGMKAMLAAALAPDPSLLLMDEPFGPLDPSARDEVVRGMLTGLASDGNAVLVATHDLHMAARIADRVVLLEGGCVSAQGSIEDVLGHEEEVTRAPERLRGLFERDSVERMNLR